VLIPNADVAGVRRRSRRRRRLRNQSSDEYHDFRLRAAVGSFFDNRLPAGGVMELGYRIGSWRHARTLEEKDQPVDSMVASILGLVVGP
jgi:hypothetical protein